MPLQIKITPLRAGTATPADQPQLFSCPPDLQPDQILPFLVSFFGEDPIENAWATTARHQRLRIGWIFPARFHGDNLMDNVELQCVPVIGIGDAQKPFFETLADQRQDCEPPAANDTTDSPTIIEAPRRTSQRQPASG